MLKEVMLSMAYNVNIHSYFKLELYDRGINYTSNLCMMILCIFFITDFCPSWPYLFMLLPNYTFAVNFPSSNFSKQL